MLDCVVAFINQETCEVFRRKEDAPPGSVVFAGPPELAAILSIAALDTMRARLTGEAVEYSSSRLEAATRLWFWLTRNAEERLRLVLLNHLPNRVDAFGNKKNRDTNERYELLHYCWVPGKDPLMDILIKKKVAPQAKVMIQIIETDGRKVFTIPQLVALMEAHSASIGSVQPMEHLLRYYLNQRLIPYKVLRKLTFAEFSCDPVFQGVDLDLDFSDVEFEKILSN